MPTKTHKVTVPQSEGEIRISRGDDPVVYPVTDGAVTVADADLATFLAHVDGAALASKEK